MKENIQVPSNRLEGFQLDIAEVTSADLTELESVRRETDDNIDEKKFKRELEHYGGGGKQTAFLVRDNGKVVGFIEVDAVADYIPKGAEREASDDKEAFDSLKTWARVGRIALLEEYRGKKIGNQLLKHAEEWARSHGQEAIWLDYLAANTQLETFYTEAGYDTLMDFKDGDKERLRRIAVKHL